MLESWDYPYFFRVSCTMGLGTISSLKVYAPVFSDRTALITLAYETPPSFFSVATTFFAIIRLDLPPWGALLFDFLMHRYLFQDGIEFFQFQALGCVFPVFGSDVPGSAGHSTLFVFRAFQDHLNSITFLSHCFV
jgi:hypothetical protein